MAVNTAAAPPTSWPKHERPQIDKTAYVHSFSNLVGDVKVGPDVLIAPGTSIRADEGTPFSINEGTTIQDGVIIHGQETGKVLGDDGEEYSVWIGKQVCLGHMALIHGPAYLGDQCFVGFRSTLFNSRVGQGSIVMMHALVQDVEIAPGKFVPSGSIITSQEQADRLPDIQPKDLHLVAQIRRLGETKSLISSSELSRDSKKIGEKTAPLTKETQYTNLVDTMSLTAEIKEQVRSLLNQGYTIGVEHADKRRFKTSSWLSCGTITASRPEQVIQQLEGYLAEYLGEYVRLIGVDSKAKKRVLEIVIQRPNGAETPVANKKSVVATPTSSSSAAVDNNIASHIRSLLAQGCKIATEYANARRFKTSSWQTGGVIESKKEAEIINALNGIMAEHQGEYVRLIGINPTAKRRVLELIVQRPGETASNPTTPNTAHTVAHSSSASSLSAEIVHKIRSLLQQGYKIGTEHADKRRFKTGSWTSCAPIESTREAEVLEALAACLVEHQDSYVRLLGIDSKAKRRVLETVIARPGDTAPSVSHSTSAPKVEKSQTTAYNGNGKGKEHLSGDTLAQIRSLLQQGYKIGTEHADKRRFKTSSWSSCGLIESNRENDIIAALTNCLDEHQGSYVRLIGIDTKAKRRVLETIIQRP